MDDADGTLDSARPGAPLQGAGARGASGFADRLAAVQDRLARAAARAGRPAEAVRLLPVSKTFPADAVLEGYALGLRDFGENRVKELAEKAALCPPDIRWHLIGHLQRNKVRAAAQIAAFVQSVDSVRLAEALESALTGREPRLPVLIEINATGATAKHGFALARAFENIAAIAPRCPHLAIEGLMTLGPTPAPGAAGPDERASRAAFAAVRGLRERLEAARLPRVSMRELSMGMSGDLEWAVEEGSTMVRVGTALFGQRSVR